MSNLDASQDQRDANASVNPAGVMDLSVQDKVGEGNELLPKGKSLVSNDADPVLLVEGEKEDESLTEKRREVADRALIAAVKIVVELRRAQDLQAYAR